MIKNISLCVLIIVLVCGCSSQPLSVEYNEKFLPSPEPSVSLPVTMPFLETPHDTIISDVSPAIAAYKKVLHNEIEFFAIDLQRNISLQDYCMDECTVDDFIQYYEFTFVNMVGDDVPEVVLYIGPPGTNLIFHYENDKVYGYGFGTPTTKNIKTNGMFETENKVYWSLCKLEFIEETYSYIEIAASDSNNDLGETFFYLNDIAVTEDEFRCFVDNSSYWEVDRAQWYEFNNENIDLYLIWEE